jgi:hypothetical protein
VKIKQEQDERGRSKYTLGGAKAGLQSAKDMKHEAKKLKQKEDDAFAQVIFYLLLCSFSSLLCHSDG